ncbi:D-2-hydroxyacid dehydrogenase [Elioraea rosea]|uniref:D-2-hydroxyacid dehydrogenase n=1 Tax=Elioraea rosea TaxID=2492390 RepID=UPI001EF48E9D|nr:D-2-hydroxyacid dehydrogenase [Elioraea rosea]
MAQTLHVHIQNPSGETQFPITPALWDEAKARAGEAARDLRASFADDDAGFAAAMGTADVLITWTKEIKARFPHPAPSLKWVMATSAGLDRLAPFDMLPAHVKLLNNSGAHAVKAGEWGLMAVLMIANRIPTLVTAQRESRWQPIFARSVAGRTAVIVGLGDLGGSIAARCAELGMTVIGCSASGRTHPACVRVVTSENLDTVLPGADVLVLAMPLTPKTRGMITRGLLSLLPMHAGVVNIARGSVIDQDALCDMLSAGRISGAVLDVFDPEPIPPGHRLWRTPNLVISPHVSSDDPDTYNPRTLDIFFRNLAAWRAGEQMPNEVDRARGY